MKNKKNLLIITIIFLIFIFSCVFFTINQENKLKKPKEHTKTECVNKGEICTSDEIKKGILISYDVNENDTHDFYVIDNDENYMTLISDELIEYSNWNPEGVNFKGPIMPLYKLHTITNTWTNVETIDDYTYSDYGYRNCLQNENEEESTLCKEGGYHKIQFGKNSGYIETNIIEEDRYQNIDLGDTKFKSRLITVEEIVDLDIPLWLSDNLKDGQGFWTMSSSTAVNTHFISGAYALMYIDGKSAIESLDVGENNIGLKAVIVVAKK